MQEVETPQPALAISGTAWLGWNIMGDELDIDDTSFAGLGLSFDTPLGFSIDFDCTSTFETKHTRTYTTFDEHHHEYITTKMEHDTSVRELTLHFRWKIFEIAGASIHGRCGMTRVDFNIDGADDETIYGGSLGLRIDFPLFTFPKSCLGISIDCSRIRTEVGSPTGEEEDALLTGVGVGVIIPF